MLERVPNAKEALLFRLELGSPLKLAFLLSPQLLCLEGSLLLPRWVQHPCRDDQSQMGPVSEQCLGVRREPEATVGRPEPCSLRRDGLRSLVPSLSPPVGTAFQNWTQVSLEGYLASFFLSFSSSSSFWAEVRLSASARLSTAMAKNTFSRISVCVHS